ncbi:MAG TPA: class I SAM-dependent methyltransferase [Pseudomonadota bacterium]|nr:class I SAM-dependent methyltransferase [Pseudomonadota bacterium]
MTTLSDPTDENPLTDHLSRGSTQLYLDAALYDHDYRRRRHDIAWYRRLAKDMLPERNQSILELACGTGRLLFPLARDGHHVIGIDRSAHMLARCRERMAHYGSRLSSRISLVQADFRVLPIAPPEPFFLIVCPFNGLLHLYDREDFTRFFDGIRNILHPDGLFAFDVSNPDLEWLTKDPRKRWSRTRFRHPITREPLVYSTNHLYDPAHQIMVIRIYYDPDFSVEWAHRSEPRTVVLTQRLYFPAELEALLHFCGFSMWYRAGGFDGQTLSHASAEQVICVRMR